MNSKSEKQVYPRRESFAFSSCTFGGTDTRGRLLGTGVAPPPAPTLPEGLWSRLSLKTLSTPRGEPWGWRWMGWSTGRPLMLGQKDELGKGCGQVGAVSQKCLQPSLSCQNHPPRVEGPKILILHHSLHPGKAF